MPLFRKPSRTPSSETPGSTELPVFFPSSAARHV